MSSNVAEHDAPEQAEIAQAPSTPEISKYTRIRKITFRVVLAAAALLAADTARVVYMRSAPKNPVAAMRPYGSTPIADLDRDTPLPELFDALRNPEEASKFLKKYQRQDTPQNPVAFTSTFRTSAQEFLKRGSGCCNNFPNSGANCGWRRVANPIWFPCGRHSNVARNKKVKESKEKAGI